MTILNKLLYEFLYKPQILEGEGGVKLTLGGKSQFPPPPLYLCMKLGSIVCGMQVVIGKQTMVKCGLFKSQPN